MFDRIDPRSPTPLYDQIAARIRMAVAVGDLQPGAALPSVRQLAAELRINPATVVQAYKGLEAEGVLSIKQGAGTFVQAVAPERRAGDRAAAARKLVHAMVLEAGGLGISTEELQQAIEQELNGRKRL